MFGSRRPNELYTEQAARNDGYAQLYEYRTVSQASFVDFDLQVNASARVGWEAVGFQVSGGQGNAPNFFALLRRRRNP